MGSADAPGPARPPTQAPSHRRSQRRSQRRTRWIDATSALVVTLSTLSIPLSYSSLSQTWDEPLHIATGMQWLADGRYDLQRENPPLAPIFVALGPLARGLELPGRGTAAQQGSVALYSDASYARALAAARLGTLPFGLLAAFVAWAWARRRAGPWGALLAVTLLGTLPTWGAHAGLATTDVAAAATLFASLYAFTRWLELPTASRALWLGAAAGLAVACKLSAPAFLAVGGGAMALAHWATRARSNAAKRHGLVWTLFLSLLVASALVWSTYRFSIGIPLDGPIAERDLGVCVEGAGPMRAEFTTTLATSTVPAPELVSGLISLCAHNRRGHGSYLLGETREHGARYYHLVALAVKTPLPFLLLSGLALWSTISRSWRARRWEDVAPGLAAIAIAGAATFGNLHIGLRHALVLYPLLAATAGIAGARWLQARQRSRVVPAIVCGLVAWQATEYVASHPDRLVYFNGLAGDEPGRILVDSDLDWGQGLPALEVFFREHDARRLHIAYWGTANPCNHDLPRLEWLTAGRPVRGWVAISESYFRGISPWMRTNPCIARGFQVANPRDGYAWLESHERVDYPGRSIRLYFIE